MVNVLGKTTGDRKAFMSALANARKGAKARR
jgi:hypothetical protein